MEGNGNGNGKAPTEAAEQVSLTVVDHIALQVSVTHNCRTYEKLIAVLDAAKRWAEDERRKQQIRVMQQQAADEATTRSILGHVARKA